jgi:hypothetical protein
MKTSYGIYCGDGYSILNYIKINKHEIIILLYSCDKKRYFLTQEEWWYSLYDDDDIGFGKFNNHCFGNKND